MLKRVRDLVVYSNFWISLGSLSVALSTFILLKIPLDFYVLSFVFFSTQLQYALLKYKGIPFSETNFAQWFHKHKVFFLSCMIFSAIMCFYCVLNFSLTHLLVIFLAGLATILYTGISSFQLRNYWFLKTPMVAFVWSMLMVLLPVVKMEDLLHTDIAVLFMAVFFLINGLTIPFEIKDLYEDRKVQKLKTVPMVLGIEKTIQLANFHLLISFVLFLIFSWKLVVLFPLFLFSYLIFSRINEKSSDVIFNFYIDGVLVFVAPLSFVSILF